MRDSHHRRIDWPLRRLVVDGDAPVVDAMSGRLYLAMIAGFVLGGMIGLIWLKEFLG